MYLLRPNKRVCNPIFLKKAFDIDYIKKELLSNCKNSTQKYLKYKDIICLKIPLVSIESQNKFAEFVELIDKSKFIIQKQIKLLEELLEKKMNEYFGEYNHSIIKGDK